MEGIEGIEATKALKGAKEIIIVVLKRVLTMVFKTAFFVGQYQHR